MSFVLAIPGVFSQRVVKISSIPVDTPVDDLLFLASSVNGWNPAEPNWVFIENENAWFLTVPVSAPNTFQGKITRGSWDTVEGNAGGGFLPDRNFNFSNTDTITIGVASWEGQVADDLPENLVILDEAFFMPQLNRSRRVRILLPSNYDSSTDHYPVLYMHDGQNLFSASESFAGEWKVDEAMAEFEAQGYGGALIVAIDNGGSYRLTEYTPWANPEYGGGEGMDYSAFIVETLKPFVDQNFRTLSGADQTGIMGSSLGGLVSHFAGIAYSDVFGRVGVFSPSFWINDEIYPYTESAELNISSKFYFLAGGQESNSLQQEVQSMVDLMIAEGHPETQIQFDYLPQGQHAEWFWAEMFPTAFSWLFMANTVGLSEELNKDIEITIFPNPCTDTISIRSIGISEFDVEIIDSSGRSLGKFQTTDSKLNVSKFSSGLYQILIEINGQSVRKSFLKI